MRKISHACIQRTRIASIPIFWTALSMVSMAQSGPFEEELRRIAGKFRVRIWCWVWRLKGSNECVRRVLTMHTTDCD